jgi:hypothetical protein
MCPVRAGPRTPVLLLRLETKLAERDDPCSCRYQVIEILNASSLSDQGLEAKSSSANFCDDSGPLELQNLGIRRTWNFVPKLFGASLERPAGNFCTTTKVNN